MMRLGLGTAIVATPDGRPSAIVGLILPLDDDLLYHRPTALRVAAKAAHGTGKRGDALIWLQPFMHLDPGDDFDPETPNDPRDLGDP